MGLIADSTDFSEPEVLDVLTAEHSRCLLKQQDVVRDPNLIF